MLRHASADGLEDLYLLPLLLMAAGSPHHRSLGPATFMEMGAYDGITASQTTLFERCLGWDGVLVEANPTNFQKLERSGRHVHLSHAAAGGCNKSDQALISTGGEDVSGLQEVARGYPFHETCVGTGCAVVPCASLLAIANSALGQRRLTCLSLDVEGAEAMVFTAVLDALQAFPIDVMLVEAATSNHIAQMETAKVRALLNSTGYVRQKMPAGFGIPTFSQNDVWVAPWLAAQGSQQLITAHKPRGAAVKNARESFAQLTRYQQMREMRLRGPMAQRLRNATILELLLPDRER